MSKEKTPALLKVSRLLDLVPYLTTHQNISVSDLALRFQVSKKEIIDDLNTLWMCGLPGYTPLELIDLSFEDGYVTISNAQTLESPRSLTGEELITLNLGIDLLLTSETLSAEQIMRIKRIQEKILSIIGSSSGIITNVDSAHRAVILQAISERNSLAIDYHSLVRDEVRTRTVSPLSIYVDNRVEYLEASTSDGVRTFRLDRVSSVSIIQESEKPVAQTATARQIKAELQFTKSDRYSAESLGVVASLDMNSLTAAIECFSPEWLERTILSCAGAVELRSPHDLRTKVRLRASKLLEIYSTDGLPA